MPSTRKKQQPSRTGVSSADSMVESKKSPPGRAARATGRRPQDPKAKAKKSAHTRRSAKKPKVTVRDQIAKVIDCLIEILKCYGYRESDDAKGHHASRLSTIERWVRMTALLGSTRASWMQVAKYKLAAYYHSHTNQASEPVPPLPLANGVKDLPHILMCGRLGRFSDLLAKHRPQATDEQRGEQLSFLQSILLSKKGMPRPDTAMVSDQVKKTVAALTTLLADVPDSYVEQPLLAAAADDWNISEEAAGALPEVHNYVTWAEFDRRTAEIVDTLFAEVKYDRKDATRPYLPSTKSSFEDTQGDGGQFAAIRDLLMELDEKKNPDEAHGIMPPPSNLVHFSQKSLHSPEPVRANLGERKRAADDEEIVDRGLPEDGDISELRSHVVVRPTVGRILYDEHGVAHAVEMEDTGFAEEDPRWYRSYRVREFSVGGYEADTTGLDRRFNELWHAALQRAMASQHFVRPVGLAEALKIRVITKGDPFVGFVLKPLQKLMWGALHQHQIFQLIGTPVTAQIVQRVMGRELLGNEFYLSGDYSAATDNLNPKASECVARHIARAIGLPEEEKQLFIAALTGHLFEGRKENGLEFDKRQEWGQLMGSVISFPVLCIANAVVCKWALEVDSGRVFDLDEVPILINGDDCLLRCTKSGHDTWRKLSSFIGLTPSVGKYYLTRDFANINSTCFQRLALPVEDEDGELMHFRMVQAVNLGLMYGLKRSSEVIGKADLAGVDETLGTRARELMANCPFHCRRYVWKCFLDRHWKTLEKCGVPWYMPEKWGGIGLPPMLTVEALAYEQELRRQVNENDLITPLPTMPERYFVENDDGTGRFGPTKLDLQLAAVVLGAPTQYLFRMNSPEVDWDIWKVAQSYFPAKTDVVDYSTHELARYNQTMSAACAATLFAADSPFNPRKRKRMNALRENAKVWSKLQHLRALPSSGASWITVTYESPPVPILRITALAGKSFGMNPSAPLAPPQHFVGRAAEMMD